jgi:hypothetical protein
LQIAPSAPVPGPAPHIDTVSNSATSIAIASNTPVAREQAPDASLEATRFYVRTSYVDAHYSNLESDLQNGASTIALGLSRGLWPTFEGRVLLELGHGMDQTVTIQNTRFLTLRADATYLPISGALTPLASLGLGFTDFDVKSERATASGDTVTREHAKGTGALIAPALGGRLRIGNTSGQIAIDLTAEYLAVIGSGQTSSLGGVAAALGIGLTF